MLSHLVGGPQKNNFYVCHPGGQRVVANHQVGAHTQKAWGVKDVMVHCEIHLCKRPFPVLIHHTLPAPQSLRCPFEATFPQSFDHIYCIITLMCWDQPVCCPCQEDPSIAFHLGADLTRKRTVTRVTGNLRSSVGTKLGGSSSRRRPTDEPLWRVVSGTPPPRRPSKVGRRLVGDLATTHS